MPVVYYLGNCLPGRIYQKVHCTVFIICGIKTQNISPFSSVRGEKNLSHIYHKQQETSRLLWLNKWISAYGLGYIFFIHFLLLKIYRAKHVFSGVQNTHFQNTRGNDWWKWMTFRQWKCLKVFKSLMPTDESWCYINLTIIPLPKWNKFRNLITALLFPFMQQKLWCS